MTDPRLYHVLIVDDSDTDRALIKIFLERSKVYKFDIDLASDPEEGIRKIASGKYDCVMLDYNMPEYTGIDLINRLRNEAGPGGSLPVATILLTGQGDEALAVEAIQLGAEDYLIKDRLHNGVLPRAVVKAVESFALRRSEQEAVRALKESEHMFRMTAERIPQLIWVAGPDGKTRFVNNRWLTSSLLPMSEVDFGCENFLGTLHKEDRAACQKAWAKALRNREPFSAELRMQNPAGEWRWYLCRSEPVLDENGVLQNWFGTCTDVHEMRQTREELYDRETKLQKTNDELKAARDMALAANRAKSVFLATMSHEFRTPLNTVIGYAEMLADEAEDSGEADTSKDLSRIRSAGRHLLSLIDDVLDLARVEAGEISVAIKKINLCDIIADAVGTAQWLVDQNENELRVSLPEDDIIPVYGDATRVRQVIFNLLSNAAKFTKGGTIAIGVTIDPDIMTDDSQEVRYVRVSVSDTGIGIPKENHAKLFTPFYQGNGTTQERYGGTGLGLAISRNLCRMMNGDIVMESEPGKGSCFTLLLPLASSEIKKDPVTS